jgi:subtilase-type serine protease
MAQLTYKELVFDSSGFTGVTGIRGDNMTGNYAIAGTGNTGGLLYRFSTGAFQPFPMPTANGSNFPGAISSTPYGPTFGAPTGILRVVGSFITASYPYNQSFLYDGAAAPGQQITPVLFPSTPGANPTLETIAHSTFGNQVVGNYDTDLKTGKAFIYNIATGTYTTNDRRGPGGLELSTTAYGVWGNRIAGGTTDPGPGGNTHGYIFNQNTGTFTLYDAPGVGVIATHFEGITAAGRAGEYNLVADSADATGTHAWAVHVDANGVATWVELKVTRPGSRTCCVTSGNSIYQDTAIGIFVDELGNTKAFTTTVPGFYNPLTNNGTLTANTAGVAAISALTGDDVVNNGTVIAAGANSLGIASGPYGVIQNHGLIGASGPGSVAVQMNNLFGTLINEGVIAAAPGALAIQTGPSATGTLIVNSGVIDGQVSVAAGPFARFQNSGWMGISAPGSGVAHAISGVFAQTSTGTLALRVGANGVSDQLLVNGQARLAGTAQASFQSGALSNSYTLLSATGGYTGTFDTFSTQNLPGFLSASLGYGTNNVSLYLQSSMASTPGLGGNQLSVARALDTAFNAGPGLGAMLALFGLSQGQIPSALSMLAGDNASVGQSMAFAAGGQFSALLSGRAGTRRAEELAAACAKEAATSCDPPTQWGAWATGFGGAQWLNADSSTGSAASQQTIGGGAFGADYRAGPQTLVGAAVGLSGSSYTVSTTNASGQATGVHFGLYASHDFQPFYVTGALAYSHFDGNATRVVSGIGNTETEKSSPGSNQLASRVEVGRAFDIGQFQGSQMSVTPFAALQPAGLWTPGFSESSVAQTGTGVFALTYQAQSTASLPTFLGAQLDGQAEINARPLKAWLRAAWVHEFLTSRSVTAGFTVLPGSSFVVDGARAASDAARLDLGVRYAVGSQTSLYANGNVELSGRGQSLAGTVGLRIVW